MTEKKGTAPSNASEESQGNDMQCPLMRCDVKKNHQHQPKVHLERSSSLRISAVRHRHTDGVIYRVMI